MLEGLLLGGVVRKITQLFLTVMWCKNTSEKWFCEVAITKVSLINIGNKETQSDN